MKFAELQSKDVEELKKLLPELKAELRAVKFRIASGDVKTVHKVQDIKKEIARILTILNGKKK